MQKMDAARTHAAWADEDSTDQVWIVLDVSGTLFHVSEATLRSAPPPPSPPPSPRRPRQHRPDAPHRIHPDSFFTRLLDFGGACPKRRRFLIDRCPVLFWHVLQYLRTLKLSTSDASVLQSLVHEAEFFQLPALREAAARAAEESVAPRLRKLRALERMEEHLRVIAFK